MGYPQVEPWTEWRIVGTDGMWRRRIHVTDLMLFFSWSLQFFKILACYRLSLLIDSSRECLGTTLLVSLSVPADQLSFIGRPGFLKKFCFIPSLFPLSSFRRKDRSLVCFPSS